MLRAAMAMGAEAPLELNGERLASGVVPARANRLRSRTSARPVTLIVTTSVCRNPPPRAVSVTP